MNDMVHRFEQHFDKTGVKIAGPAENTSYKRQTKKLAMMKELLKEAKILLEAKEGAYRDDYLHMKNNLLQKIMAVLG